MSTNDIMHLSMLLDPGWGGGGGYPWEIDSESLSLGREIDNVCVAPWSGMSVILEHGENLEMSYPQPLF